MIWLTIAMGIALLAAIGFLAAAGVQRIRKRAYKTQWRIAGACFGAGTGALMLLASGGEWGVAALLASLLLMIYGACQAVVWGVRKIRKKETGSARVKAAVSLPAGLCALVLAAGGDLTATLNLFSALFLFAAPVLLLVSAVRAIFRRNSKALWLSVPACLAVGVLLMTAANVSWGGRLEKQAASGEIHEEPIQITYDFEVVDGDEPIRVIDSKCYDLPGSRAVYVYDEDDLHLALEKDFATADECIDAIEGNERIEAEFKVFFCDFVERIDDAYPGLNLAILYQNLETLDVQELSASEYLWESLSLNSLGCYNKRKNTIFIPEGTEYTEGEFGFQVLIHEFCHAVRSGEFRTDDTKCSFDFYEDSDHILLSEAMNSVFSCSLLNYYEWNIAYQVPSNYLRIMLECMDNYCLEDYIRHPDTYFLSRLDEFTGNTNYAQVIWKLIALQRSDWEDDRVDIPPEEYHPIYEYLCRMYYGKYVTGSMTDAEKRAVADELVHKAFYDAPENYKINPGYFYEYLGL